MLILSFQYRLNAVSIPFYLLIITLDNNFFSIIFIAYFYLF